MWRWWTALDGAVERALLHRQARSETLLLYSGLAAVVVTAVVAAWVWPGLAAEFLFVQLALLVFFFGLGQVGFGAAVYG